MDLPDLGFYCEACWHSVPARAYGATEAMTGFLSHPPAKEILYSEG
ncbi:MAG: hypothetical protein R3E96_00255 [Planctomycetota bacterium]